MLNIDTPRLGSQIKLAREKLRINQTELAERAGISGGYLSAIEKDKVKPSLRVLESLQKQLNGAMSDENDTLENLIQRIVDRGFRVTVSRG